MKPLKPGDRVAVYGFIAPVARITGTVDHILGDVVVFNHDECFNHFNLGKNCSAHRKQCRLLTKKPRKTLWYKANSARFWDCAGFFVSEMPQSGEGWTRFIETKETK